MAGRHKTPDDERSEDATQAASAAAAATGKAKPRSRAVTLRAGRNPKLARASGGVWSSKREQKFFTALAETCNVTLAAEAAGVHPARAYERRRSVAAFRQAWGEALAIGYARLELMLLERSLNGSEKIVRHKDGSEERMREYPNQIALALLKLHRDSVVEAETEYREEEIEETRDRILAKLEKLKTRQGAERG